MYYCPTLGELPSPPTGRNGWPWTEETPRIPETMPDGNPWPRVSVITPSYNQDKFIEETIRSVLLQRYPNLEYIIIDGGSTDESLNIIKQYEPWLAYWASEPDRGQSHAINKGLRRASGDIIAYLNSDDLYLPGAVRQAVQFLSQDEESDIVYGDCRVVDKESQTIFLGRGRDFDLFVELCRNFVYQPTVFMRRKLLDLVGYLDEELNYAMDVDYWLRAAMKVKFSYLPVELAAFRITESSKTGKDLIPFDTERLLTIDRFFCSHADRKVIRWRKRVFAWNHYRIGSRLYVQNKRDLARREFIKVIKLEPFSLRTVASLMMLFDIHAHTKFFLRIAAFINIGLKPPKQPSFWSDISSLSKTESAEN
jgi:glycosyltransferase involved in cell wall biosynthesis